MRCKHSDMKQPVNMNRSTQIDELVGTTDLNVSVDLYDTDEPPKDQSVTDNPETSDNIDCVD